MERQKDIGGYFELECFNGKHYHEAAIKLNSGRGCLAYLIELRNISTLWLPIYLCGCIEDLCKKHNVTVKHYNITPSLLPNYNFKMGEDDYLYLVDYFGQLQIDDVLTAGSICGGRLIVDEIQGFFRRPWKNADTLYSCRKWFGVSDGAYLYTKDGDVLHKDYPLDESYERMHFVLGRFEKGSNPFYREADFNELIFTEEGYKEMSPITSNLLGAIDYDVAISKRDSNWNILADSFFQDNVLSPEKPVGPFRYPLLLSNANAAEIRSSLMGRRIYVPVLWPNVLVNTKKNSIEHYYSSNILPLPLDHRYNCEDMIYMVHVIKELLIV